MWLDVVIKKKSFTTLSHILPQNAFLKYVEMWLKVAQCGGKIIF